ncbi:MAG: hypothetical protein IPK85_07465 [Gemmatimonadetes bacterium]|nr:hypothetical protein [Gemmatimonadota bacterium]
MALSRWRELVGRRKGNAGRRLLLPAAAISAVILVASVAASEARVAAPIPERLSDAEFWALSSDLSEPAGYFRSDNLVGNEVTMQHPIPALVDATPRGGVYLGVGPDQNFTYIAAMKPKIAFVVDIRRLNVMQHLYYKSLFELSATRADYLSRLFARPRPSGLDTTTSIEAMMLAYQQVPADSGLYLLTMQELREHLRTTHAFPMTDAEYAGIEYVATAFYTAGPELTYNFGSGRGGRGFGGGRYMPTYGQMMAETDAQGVPRSYLGSEENYRTVREMQRRNLIVPVTGDFAGPKALRAVGNWVRAHDATISAFYTSNVEQYLFQSDVNWRAFFSNVATLPLTPQSTFIRALFNMGGYGPSPGPRSVTMLCPIERHVAAYHAGTLSSYYDVAGCPAR